ncbi:MAG: flagellar motor switch phosphatase FliY [Bacillota bacterium]|jgi:flagellar motor switch protein FliN/FliY
MSEMLTQEEIDALLAGASEGDRPPKQEKASSNKAAGGIIPNNFLNEMEKDALGEIGNISMGTAATTLSQLLGKRVHITTPKVDIVTAKKIIEDYPIPHVLIHVQYKKGLSGSNLLVLSQEDGGVIVDLMMGGAGIKPSGDLNEIQISGIAEAMNQMMGSAATSMSTVFNAVVDITPPQVIVGTLEQEEETILEIFNKEEPMVRVVFKMVVEGVLDSVLLQVIPINVAKEMVNSLMSAVNGSQLSNAAPPPEPRQEPLGVQLDQSHFPRQMPTAGVRPQQEGGTHKVVDHPTEVQPAQFSQLTTTDNLISGSGNLELIYDVPLQVSVELGRASKTVREILELGPGSVVELDRLAGEPVDMIVNGKLIAKCEVVVINETFGIRITEIVSSDERMETFN